MGWRRVWRDIRLRRPAFDLVPDPAAPMRYRGRPFSLDRLPIGGPLRKRLDAWAAAAGLDDGDEAAGGDAAGAALAADLADAMRAPVAFGGSVHRPHR